MSFLSNFVKDFATGCRTIVKSLGTTLPYLFGLSDQHKEVTEEYPDRVSARMPEDMPVRFRGFIHNDISRCSGCRLCVDACPVDCIRIEAEQGHEKNLNWVAVFDVDIAKCIFCGLCVEVCPTGSLTHTRKYEGAVFHLKDLVYSYGRGWATQEMKLTWQSNQATKDAQAEERASQKQSPVGSELRRINRENKND